MGFNIFAMPASSVVLLFSIALGVSNALPWAEPQQTRAYQADAWSPAPTGIPADPANLFKRSQVDVNVCGWIGANSARPAACPSDSSCIHDTIHWAIGCCATSGPCTAGVFTSCVDNNSQGWSANSGLADNGIYTCTGDSYCYRNNYPGGYYQYSCGASSDATYVDTTYSGMASDLNLQVVYTGIYFTPTTAPTTTSTSSASTSTSSPTTASSLKSPSSSPSLTSSPGTSTSGSQSTSSTATGTSPVIGKVSPTTPATATPPKKNVGAVAGGTIGGLAILTTLSLVGLFLLKRHHQKGTRYSRAGPFTGAHSSGAFPPSPASRPSQELAPFSPDDVMIGNTTNITAGSAPGKITFPPTYAYAGSSDPHHPYANVPPTPYFPPPKSEVSSDGNGRAHSRSVSMQDAAPLGGTEIEDFSRGYRDAIQTRMKNEEIEGGRREAVPGGVGGSGIGMGITGLDAPLLSGHRAEDREARSEAFREQLRIRNQGWSPKALRSNPFHRYDKVESAHGSGSDGEEDEEVEPLRGGVRGGVLNAAVGRRSPDDEREIYQNVDEQIGDDVPILQSPVGRP